MQAATSAPVLNGAGRKVALFMGGAMNPPHLSHIGAMQEARKALEARGFDVVAGYLVPSTDGYVSDKMTRSCLPTSPTAGGPTLHNGSGGSCGAGQERPGKKSTNSAGPGAAVAIRAHHRIALCNMLAQVALPDLLCWRDMLTRTIFADVVGSWLAATHQPPARICRRMRPAQPHTGG
jgi:hypothetical protein